MKVNICCYLHCAPTSTIDVPGIQKWSDIKEWHVKWDTLHYTLDEDTWLEVDIGSESLDATDWKRPQKVIISDELSYEVIEEQEG